MIRGVLSLSIALFGLGQPAGEAFQEPADYFPRSLYETTVTCRPFGVETRWALLSEFKAGRYADQLDAAGEAPLFDREGQVLRFTWLRSRHAPVIVRLETAADGRVTMTATELTGRGGGYPGEIARRIERGLSAAEVADLARVLERTRALEQPPTGCDFELQGAQWLLESTGPEGYRFVERLSPRDGPVREVGLYLIRLTGWRYGAVY